MTNWDRLLLALIVVSTIPRAIANTDEVIYPPMQPEISGKSKHFLKGETFTINCTVKYKTDSPVTLTWEFPNTVSNNTIIIISNEHEQVNDTLYTNVTVVNATKEHNGTYICIAQNNRGIKEQKFTKLYLDEPTLSLSSLTSRYIETQQKIQKIQTEIRAYPDINYYYFLQDNKPLPEVVGKYKARRTSQTVSNNADVILEIKNCQVNDSANYTLVATNKYLTRNITYVIRFKGKPTVTFGNDNGFKVYDLKMLKSLTCSAIGYPLPKMQWAFIGEEDGIENVMESSSIRDESVYKRTAELEIKMLKSGNITCKASNSIGSSSITRRFLVYEMPNGFGIRNRENNWFSQNQDVTLTCVASKYDFAKVTWLGSDGEELVGIVERTNNSLSLVAKLKINQVSLNHSGNYTCLATWKNGTEAADTISISVAARQPPVIIEPVLDRTEEVTRFQPFQLSCFADGVPPPTLQWYKDGELLVNDTDSYTIYVESIDRTTFNSTVLIPPMQDEFIGTYECVASADDHETKRTYKLTMKVEPPNMAVIGVIIAIILFLILLVAYLTWKVKKEKQFKRELKTAGLLYFKKGVTKSLNPTLGIDEQAELLPYDEKFEFPFDKLKLGHQLGAGAFGVVYKAEARGIINAEETTEVAVKMVKKTADNMYIKALASELKIMVHLGKHINIVNLLGACTKNVVKRELIVIVEYCKFGNIHNYMQRHREVFIDQLTDNNEKNFGRVNRGFSYTGGSTGAQSDYFSMNNTQDTDHTFLNTANSNRSGRKVSEGYVQPEWRTTYESDYSFDGCNPRPLTSRDLLVWAFQIARGMEYLASRKVLHGDLAARNILLAEDNIVKICDFGLARSIYNNDEYQKKENCLLPLKWLAIECMTDRIFSTQSDVWSFGIVLWELFSLAKTPYPNIGPADLLQWLSEGNRLAKPNYSDDKIYNVMLKCWEQKPTSRPSFSQLQELLGGFLEENVRNHYVDLNSPYTDMNVKTEGQEDYLAMVCAPDYNNLVTPSPHHYVNEARSFFPPTPTQLDEEGYLQMSPVSKQAIFSPRLQDTKFDFDARKYNPRVSEASSYGSELTPMLDLNNLPTRSGSESDHEGNASPYLKKCTMIKEESDEVFETQQNNAKNALNTAVTNPTYITLDVDIEKKPKDINNYINVPNGGLVK